MNALIFDLDGVGIGELRNLFLRFDGDPKRVRRLPKSLKYDLTFRIWEYKGTSQLKAIQYQSINQGFRMVGSINAKYGTELVAFRTGERVTLDYLNAYAIKPENRWI